MGLEFVYVVDSVVIMRFLIAKSAARPLVHLLV